MDLDCAVIIPLYNGVRLIGAALDSVIAQDHKPSEIVVVDDGSSDGSPALVESYGHGVTLFRKERGGPPSARNLGLRHTKAPLVAFLDQDDIWHHSHLRILSNILANDPTLPAVSATVATFADGSSPSLTTTNGDCEYDPWAVFPLLSGIPCPSAVLIRRAALEEHGPWTERFTGVADFHLWLRLSVRHVMRMASAITIGRRLHEGSHLQTLVKTKALSRLTLRTVAAHDALQYRLDAVGDPTGQLTHRVILSDYLQAIGEALMERDIQKLERVALKADEILSAESEIMTDAFFQVLRFSLCPRDGDRGEHIWRFLAIHWPSHAAHTRERLMRLRL